MQKGGRRTLNKYKSCDLGQTMTRYDFIGARRVILSNVQTDFNLT